MDKIDTTSVEQFLSPYLPHQSTQGVFITATWAQSLDGRIAAGPGERTQLSGLYSKKMTHFLRTQHDAILVGRKTVAADNPKLNCRYAPNAKSPQPVILDAALNWDINSTNWDSWQILANASIGLAKGPWVIVDTDVNQEKVKIIEDKCHGKVIRVNSTRDWQELSNCLSSLGIKSLMVEGGSAILDGCLKSGQVNSVIITLSPVFLGRKGVDIATSVQHRLQQVRWWSDSDVADGVVAGTLIQP